VGGVDAGVRHALAFSDARITEGQGLGGGLMAIGKSFVESLLTELLILCVVRTWRPIFPGRPGRLLVLSSVGVAFLALLLPYLPAIAGDCRLVWPGANAPVDAYRDIRYFTALRRRLRSRSRKTPLPALVFAGARNWLKSLIRVNAGR